MPQTFSQNGHTLWSMWTLWSSWPFEKPCFLVVEGKGSSVVGDVDLAYLRKDAKWLGLRRDIG